MRVSVSLPHFQPLSEASVLGLQTRPSREEGQHLGVIYYLQIAGKKSTSSHLLGPAHGLVEGTGES